MTSTSVPRTAQIIVIGDEILSGEVKDENAAFLAKGLTDLGIRVQSIRFIPDELETIVAELLEALRGPDLVLVSGGIGPTHDDVTREAVARVVGVGCRRHAEAEERLRAGYGPSITESELAMADLPEGVHLLYGMRTGVFGFGIDRLVVMPGVPHLLRDIFEKLAEEWGGSGLHRAELHTDLREGFVADGLRRIQGECPAVTIGSYPFRTAGGYRLRIVLRSADRDSLDGARSRVEELIDRGTEAG